LLAIAQRASAQIKRPYFRPRQVSV
jgi:hypothetical protein